MNLKSFIKSLFKRKNKLDDRIMKGVQTIEETLLGRAQLIATIDPKVQSGDLFNSIRTIRKKTNDEVEIRLTAGNNLAYYAPFIEYGTKDGRLYPREFLKKAHDRTLKRVPAELRNIAKLYLEDIRNA